MINTFNKICPKSRGQNPPDDHGYANSLMHRGILDKKWSKPNLVEWFRINKLSLNAAKSCYIIFSAPNKNRDYSDININIDGNNMDQVISTKFLGIYIDQHLTWAEHIKI